MDNHALLLLIALLVDWLAGDPKWLWDKIPHPVTGFGRAIGALDEFLNDNVENPRGDNPAVIMRKGALVIVSLIIAAIAFGLLLDGLLSTLGVFGRLVEIAIVWIFLAQKSLLDHVEAVAVALRKSGLEGGRKAVSLVVGRDPNSLDEAGVSRAAVESLAENFCDGVVAPGFWYLVFGLPGLIAYKMINTADSMIAHKNQQYLHFGRATAQIDDLANWLPARISAVIIALGGVIKFGPNRGADAISVAMRDAGLHRSPNAGWPEAAMAGACRIALGGPRRYDNETVPQAFINATGKRDLGPGDINIAMAVFTYACYALWVVVLVWFILV